MIIGSGESALEVSGPRILGLATYPPGATFGPRSMVEYEFVGMVEGNATLTVDDDVVSLPEGSIALCRPGTTHFFRWDPRRPTRHTYCHFSIVRLPKAWPPPNEWPDARAGAGRHDVLSVLFRHLLTWAGRGDVQIGDVTIAQMLACFVTGQTDASELSPPRLPDPVEVATAFLHDALETDPSRRIVLADLATAAGVTREHLCRLFRNSTGLTPIATVARARLDRSLVLIARSNLPLKQVAATCGFASAFHLSRRFTAAFGLSPSRLRERVGRGLLPPQPLLSRSGWAI